MTMTAIKIEGVPGYCLDGQDRVSLDKGPVRSDIILNLMERPETRSMLPFSISDWDLDKNGMAYGVLNCKIITATPAILSGRDSTNERYWNISGECLCEGKIRRFTIKHYDALWHLWWHLGKDLPLPSQMLIE